MPTDLSNENSYAEYVDMCTKIITVFTDSDAVSLVVAGDFNCRADSHDFTGFLIIFWIIMI